MWENYHHHVMDWQYLLPVARHLHSIFSPMLDQNEQQQMLQKYGTHNGNGDRCRILWEIK